MKNTELLDAIRDAKDLDGLLDALQEAERTLGEIEINAGYQDDPAAAREIYDAADELRHALECQCCYLPTFGGPAPDDTDTIGIYSWDATRLLLNDNGWRLVSRDGR